MSALHRGRLSEWLLAGVAVVGAFVAGAWLNPWKEPAKEATLPPSTAAREGNSNTTVAIPVFASESADPRQPEPRAVAARAAAIQRDSRAIREECSIAAGGDWEKWQRDTAGYRVDLKAKVDLPKRAGSTSDLPELQYPALESIDRFPLFEVGAREYLNHLYDPTKLEGFRKSRCVLAVDHWLRQRGIDLIFVPVPKMAEIYIEHFIQPCPPDGIIAPHLRATLLEMLDAGVEVVDGFRPFRSLRDTDDEYLYFGSDTHWAPRGTRIMAKEVAERIERYKFGARARYGLPIVKASPEPYAIDPGFFSGAMSLSIEQQQRAAAVLPAKYTAVRMHDEAPTPDDPRSPVLLIGDSYTIKFREQLIRELNLLTLTRIQNNGTTEFFAELLREPDLLAHCRVVVWVMTDQHMTKVKPLPKPIHDCLNAATP
jgi:hypothetical protein